MKFIILGALLCAAQVFANPGMDSMNVNWGQDKIQVASAWNQGIKGAGVLIGLVDSNMNYQHPQLRQSLAVNEAEFNGRPGVDDDRNGYVDDIYGWDFVNFRPPSTYSIHTTHLAGIMVADSSQGRIQGIAPEAKLVQAIFLDQGNSGRIADAVMAIRYVINRGAKIVNMSWGGAPYVQEFYDVIAQHPDVLFVTAAGNDGYDLGRFPSYPASFHLPNMIVVGASNVLDQYPSWSNYGALVDIVAPGVGVYSTGPRNDYVVMDGTNIATPFVSGAAALLWSHKPTATVAEIKAALLAGVDVGNFPVSSQGRLNVAKALANLK
ncbi:hypothetical protein AZI86_10605 [Bdellovibrio bacteriovorus]|uniref:Peptidase S8/S53 domain-containing protein n=1 Tax=Bdellovibrio bacteriovorus TaxID=959 RepID=A0A150WLJ2_BDEBC|nr:S8 family peptidase [Bdellovibrio bacteriovorus]KYG64657.1 hypothetical protein AZI86_10605 [Bdellovibrio bacteriovorus]